MPVTCRGQLLAGIVALLGACTACAGCQSSSLRGDALAGRPLVARGEAPADPADTAQARAAVLPPVAPAGATPRRSVVASAWHPVLRVSAVQVGPSLEAVPAGPADAAPAQMPVGTPPAEPAPAQVTVQGAIDLPPTGPPAHAGPVPIASSDPSVSVAPGDQSAVLLPPPRVEPSAPLVVPEGAVPYPDPQALPPGPVPPPGPPPPPPVPREFAKRALSSYIIEPPDVLVVVGSEAVGLTIQPINFQALVRPDGTIGLGIYGSVFVAGMTIDQATEAIAAAIKSRRGAGSPLGPRNGNGNGKEAADKDKDKDKDKEKDKDRELAGRKPLEFSVEQIKQELYVDVAAFNSKHYFIITDGGGYGEQVYRVAITGNETVLDALSQINGLPAVASKKRIWVARATPNDKLHPAILPVDWCGIAQRGSAVTNYQIFPGDRIYVNSDKLIRTDSFLSKFLSPFNRVFGTVLLGSSAVNSIKNGGSFGSGGGGLGSGLIGVR